MALRNRRVNRDELNPGDHIYTYRSSVGFIYTHHGIYVPGLPVLMGILNAGIYVGENKVIHFTGPEIASSSSGWSLSSSSSSSSGYQGQYCDSCGLNKKSGGGVYVICLNCFLQSGLLYLYKYGANKYTFFLKFSIVQTGIMTIAPSDPPEDVIARAKYLLQHGFGDYHLMKNNCEDFALYCKTGLLVCTGGSGQVLHHRMRDIGLPGVGVKVKLEDVKFYKL